MRQHRPKMSRNSDMQKTVKTQAFLGTTPGGVKPFCFAEGEVHIVPDTARRGSSSLAGCELQVAFSGGSEMSNEIWASLGLKSCCASLLVDF